MQKVNAEFVKGKKVLLRYDIDVALRLPSVAQGHDSIIEEDFKLRAGLDTLKLCLENAAKVIIIGHLGRPAPPAERGEPFENVEDEKKGHPPELSAKPIQAWLEQVLGQEVFFAKSLEEGGQSNNKIVLLENIRFFHGEVEGDIDFARRLASLGEVYVNEAFSAHNPGASTTILPTLFPHVKDPEGRLRPRRAAGLHFAEEVRKLREVRDNPKKPFVAIMGGAKVADKLPVIQVLARKADAVLVGGKLAGEFPGHAGDPSSFDRLRTQDDKVRLESVRTLSNVLVGKLNAEGTDIAPETTESWRSLIVRAAMIVWNGPLGKFEDPENNQTEKVARIVLDSNAEIVIGGGDTVAALDQYGLLVKAEKRAFVSVGGGAMLKFLAEGTLPTIQALA